MKNSYRSHIRIPAFDRRIKIQQYVEQRTLSGHEKVEYVDLVEIWAFKMIPSLNSVGSSTEDLESMRETLTDTVIWYIRWRPGIDAKMIILDETSNRYDITGLSEVGRKKYLMIKTLLHQ